MTISATNLNGTGSATLTLTVSDDRHPDADPDAHRFAHAHPDADPDAHADPHADPDPSAPTPVPVPNPTPSATPLPLPTVYVAAFVPVAHWKAGQPGAFTFNLSVSQVVKTTVHYTVKGTAVNGEDYDLLGGKIKIKPGKLSATVPVVPKGNLGGAEVKKVKLVLDAGNGYGIGTQGPVDRQDQGVTRRRRGRLPLEIGSPR